MKQPIVFLILMLLCRARADTQTILQLRIPGAASAVFEEKIKTFRSQPELQEAGDAVFRAQDSLAFQQLCGDLLQHFRQESYLAASLDSLQITDSIVTAAFYLGPAMRWLQLRPADDDNQAWLAAAGFREKLFTDAPLRYDVLLNMERRMLEQAENNGYPFAQVWLDSIEVAENGDVSALLRIDRRRFFVVKSPVQYVIAMINFPILATNSYI